MGKAKVRFDSFAPTASADAAIDGRTSKGSVGSRTWGNTNSAKRPVNKVRGSNAKLDDIITTSSFDGSKYLDLSSAEEFAYNEAWMWVFAFVDLDSTTDCILAYTSGSNGYLGIKAGGAALVYKANDARASEFDIAINNTNNSTTSYTFGNDVEVLILSKPASSNVLDFYNINGDFIARDSSSGNGSTFNLERIGANSSTSTEFVGELIDARFYNGSDCPPITAASLQAIGNRYKQYMN
tara:strand:+ start:4513 stop:5229 length:717 start_codon:yes stop_codon:yes gene_type:complete